MYLSFRQYLTQTEVWSGLVVEVTQRLEDKLSSKQRGLMRNWFRCCSFPGAWLRLCLTPMQLCTAFQYNRRTRCCQVLLRCILPLVLVLAIVAACMYAGVWELQK